MGPVDKVVGTVMGSMNEMNTELSQRLDVVIGLLTEIAEQGRDQAPHIKEKK